MEEPVHNSPEDMPSAEQPQEGELSHKPRPGDIRRGVIVGVSPEGVAVELQTRHKGLVPPEDVNKLPVEEREWLQEGQEVLVYVTDTENAHGVTHLSLYLARKEQDWLEAEELQQEERFWEGRVAGYNKGGLVVPFGHIRGFVPASQITGFPRNLAGEEKLARLAQLVGQSLPFRVVEVDRRKRRLVLSERLGRTAQNASRQQQVLSTLCKGESCRGRIRALTEYGAFVDIGGMVGLIHRTELAWFRVEHPCEIVQEGQEVEAFVLRVSRGRGRVSLSLKRTYPDPWPTVMERYQLNQLVEGRVIRRTGAGLFIMMDDGILGFLTEADFRQSGHSEEEIAVGQRILTRLVRIDGARRRLGLSLRRVRPAEWEEWRSRVAPQQATAAEPAAAEPAAEEPAAEEPAAAETPAVEPVAAEPAAEEPAAEEPAAAEAPAAELTAAEPAAAEPAAEEPAAEEPAAAEAPAAELTAAEPAAAEPAAAEPAAAELTAAEPAAEDPAAAEAPAAEAPAAEPAAAEPAAEDPAAAEPVAETGPSGE